MNPTFMSTQYWPGFDAFFASRAFASNPHPLGTPDYCRWQDGFIRGRRLHDDTCDGGILCWCKGRLTLDAPLPRISRPVQAELFARFK